MSTLELCFDAVLVKRVFSGDVISLITDDLLIQFHLTAEAF